MSYHNINTSSSTQSTQRSTRQSQRNILTYINNEPLFRTTQQALDYGQSVGLQGYHTHTFEGDVGYMAGVNHLQATSSATQEEVLKKIQSLSISLNSIPYLASTRDFTISGEQGAGFVLQVVATGNLFYNFKTKLFAAGFNSENTLKAKIGVSDYKGSIKFPTNGDGRVYTVILMADFSTNTVLKRGVISKNITQLAQTVVTFALLSDNASNYTTITSTTTATGSPILPHADNISLQNGLTNTSSDLAGYGLRLTRQPRSSDWVFQNTQTVDGTISSSTTVVLDDVSDLTVGTTITGVSAGSLSGTPIIRSINVGTKTLTLSSAQSFNDGITLTFHARGFSVIKEAIGLGIDFIESSVSGLELTKTVRTTSSSSTTINLNGTYGISGGDVTGVAGLNINNSAGKTTVTSVNASSSAGSIVVSAAQSIKAGTKLYFPSVFARATVRNRVKINKYPSSNRTIHLLLDNFITPGTSA